MIEQEKFPALERSADAAAGRSQRLFLNLNRTHLALLIVISIISGWSPIPECRPWLGATVAGLMLASLGLTIALRIGKHDDRWFRCRALAENLKGLAWRYAMGVTPAGEGQSADGDAEFLDAIRQIRRRLGGLEKALAAAAVDGDLITNWMRRARALDFPSRLALYRKERIQDQIDWYTRKARFNARREQLWFGVIMAGEFAAVLLAGLQAWQHYRFSVVGAVASVAACIVAWTQIKRHSDLATTYLVASEDLRDLNELAAKITREEELPSFVHQVEGAVSREHRVWLAQRGQFER